MTAGFQERVDFLRGDGDIGALGGDNGFMLGGGQAASYGTNLDGVSANTTRALSKSWVSTNSPSLEAVTEFTVDTNGFKAEFGHAGGGVMNFVSKSGTNAFHGSAYEFLRNNALDANNFFNNALSKPRSQDRYNLFGAKLGGPVWIPKLYKGRQKTFFFFDYEGLRQSSPYFNTSTVPSAAFRSGDFSASKVLVFDPFNGAVFPGNRIPANRIDPAAAKIADVLPAPNSPGSLDTANGLAADLKRHLNNEPVVARPPSTTYRFQKAFRRNKLVFAAGTAVVIALIIGLGLAAAGLRQARLRYTQPGRTRGKHGRANMAEDDGPLAGRRAAAGFRRGRRHRRDRAARRGGGGR